MQSILWWFFHTVVLFWGIKFPFHAKSYNDRGRLKYIHIIVVLIALIVPCAPAIAMFQSLSPLNATYVLLTCTAGRDRIFYSLILPIGILLAVGLSLVIIIFRELIAMVCISPLIQSSISHNSMMHYIVVPVEMCQAAELN